MTGSVEHVSEPELEGWFDFMFHPSQVGVSTGVYHSDAASFSVSFPDFFWQLGRILTRNAILVRIFVLDEMVGPVALLTVDDGFRDHADGARFAENPEPLFPKDVVWDKGQPVYDCGNDDGAE